MRRTGALLNHNTAAGRRSRSAAGRKLWIAAWHGVVHCSELQQLHQQQQLLPGPRCERSRVP